MTTLTIVAIGGAFGLMRFGIEPMIVGIILTALSGIAGWPDSSRPIACASGPGPY